MSPTTLDLSGFGSGRFAGKRLLGITWIDSAARLHWDFGVGAEKARGASARPVSFRQGTTRLFVRNRR